EKAVHRVRERESRALPPPDPVLPVGDRIGAERHGPTHANTSRNRAPVPRVRPVRYAANTAMNQQVHEPQAHDLAKGELAARADGHGPSGPAFILSTKAGTSISFVVFP